MSHEMVMEDVYNSSWHVMSENVNELYVIKKLEINCECQITCEECITCIHHYSCSCMDSAIKWNMCKHIHLVCLFLKNRNNIVSSELNKEFGIRNINNENETSTIILQLNNSKISNQSNFQIWNVLKKCSATVMPTLVALKNNSDIKPFKKLSSHQSPNKLIIIPQCRFFSTKKKTNNYKK